MFNSLPGEIFTVRNIANLIPHFEASDHATLSALEYSVNILKIKDIVVLGHSSCGGIHALLEPTEQHEYVNKWLCNMSQAREKTLKAFEGFIVINLNLFQAFFRLK